MMWWRSGSGVPSNATSRFCRTVIQGNTEPRWAIMIPRRLGARTGRPSIRTSPRSGRSNPASTLSRVDFPQPDGQTIATNSPAPTVKDMSSRADTSPSPVPNVFQTPWTETSAPTGVPPADLLQVLQSSHDEVQEQSDDADHDHSRDDEVIPHTGIAGIDDEEAESRVDRDHLRRDHDEPRYAQAHSHAGDDRRKCAGDDDMGEQLESGDAEVLRGPKVLTLDQLHARGRGKDHGEKRRQKDEEDRREVAHPEPQDSQRDPGDRGDRSQHLGHRVQGRERQAVPAHQYSQRERQEHRQPVSERDAVERRRHVPQQRAVFRQTRDAQEHLGRGGEDGAAAGGQPPHGRQTKEHAKGKQSGHWAGRLMSTGRACRMNDSSTYVSYAIGRSMIFASRESRINSSNSERISRRSPYVTRSAGRSMTHLMSSNAWLNIDWCDAMRAALVRCSGLVSSHRPAANTWSTRRCTVSGSWSISSCRTVSTQQM